jgi:signal recognition particle subunit SRP54
VFDTLQDRLAATFKNLRGKGRLSPADVDATARAIRIALLEADVALPVVRSFIARVKERANLAEVSEALNPAQQVIKIVNEELVAILGGETRRLRFAKQAPTVIMLAGLQGAGKTTLAGKLGRWLKEQGTTPMLVAADLQRPNAVTQLEVVGRQAGVTVYAPEPGSGVGDPVRVARDSIEHARRTLHDVVIIDTAGRLGIDEVLMQQAADIRSAVSPDEVLYVVDAMVGQDAVRTAQAFAEKTFDADQAAAAAAKLQGTGTDFTLDDFLQQMQAVRKMGSLSKIFGMVPGMSQYKDQIAGIDEREIDRIQAVILSMTPAERSNPKIIDGSRRARIASGSGTAVSDVNNLVDRFFEARKMMTQLANGGGMPGMPGMPGAAKRNKGRQQPVKSRTKRGSGNPAKRAAEARERATADTAPAIAANPFGNPNGPAPGAGMPEGFELPKELRDLL